MDTQTLLATVRANIAREQAELATDASELATWQALEAALTATPDPNRPPVAIPAFTLPDAVIGTPYSATLPDTTDPDGDPLSYQAAGLPTGITLTDRTLSGTPTGPAGSVSVSFLASDGKLQSAPTSATLTVKAAPVVTPPAGNAFRLLPPTVKGNQLSFNYSGGDGSPALFRANGLTDWTPGPITLKLPIPGDWKPILIEGKQGKATGSISFDLLAATRGDSPAKPADEPVTVLSLEVYESLPETTN